MCMSICICILTLTLCNRDAGDDAGSSVCESDCAVPLPSAESSLSSLRALPAAVARAVCGGGAAVTATRGQATEHCRHCK